MTNHCNNCGLCCMHMRTPPFIGFEDEWWLALPDALKAELNAWETSPRMTASRECQPCFWLDLSTGACRHYEHRPDVCRDFDVGSQSCRTYRREVGLTIEGLPVVTEDDE